MDLVLLIGSPNRLLVTQASTRNVATGAVEYLDGTAVVTATLRDATTQAEIAGGAGWPVTLSYLLGSQGRYHVRLPASLALTPYQQVDGTVVINDGANDPRTVTLHCVALEDNG